MGIKLIDTYLTWNPTTVLPDIGKIVIMESYSGYQTLLYIEDPIDEWGSNVAKWAYLPIEETKEEDTHDNEIERQLDEIKDAIHRLECDFRVNNVRMDHANNKLKSYLNEQYGYKGGWNVLPDECWGGPRYVKIKTTGDDTPESSISGPEGEVSIDELGKIFSRVMQRKEFQEAIEKEREDIKKNGC